jgi:fluoride exporter
MTEALWIGIGGFAGALARYWLANAIAARAGVVFPYGTFAINVSGSFALGLLIGLLEQQAVPPLTRLALGTGFLGAYTTFSTFTYETMRLIEEGSLLLAGLNVVGSVVLGLGASFAGLAAGRAV